MTDDHTPGSPDARVPRRSFLDALLGAGLASTSVAALYPVTRFLIPPKGGEPATASVVVGKADAMRMNSGVVFQFGSRPAILVRTAEGDFKAFTAVCTHLQCTVQYKADTSQIWCACHNGYYDLSGNVVSGPPPKPLDQFAVAVRGEPGKEDIVVSRA
ncbi:MAG: Rieske 2Fe-2S domain-containing protein [Vicinamibacterales bacterium]